MGRLACFRKRNKESGRPASHGKSGRWAVGCDPRSGHDSRKCSRRRHSQPPCGRRWSDRSTSHDCLRRETRACSSACGRRRASSKMPSSPGGDNHEMWIDPTNGDRMAVVNDGGVNISVNRGSSWNHVNLPIAQIYHVTVDDQIPYFVYGNRQDGPSWRGPSNSLQFGGFSGNSIPRGAWHPVAGGESGFAVPDPVDNNIIWSTGTGSGSIGGTVTRFDERTHQNREVEV